MIRLIFVWALCFCFLAGCGNSKEVDACMEEYISGTTLSDWSEHDYSGWDEEKRTKYHYRYIEAYCQDKYPDE